MKMPMVDMSAEHKGHINEAVRKDTNSGPGHAPQTSADVRKSGGPGLKGGTMAKACSTLSGMKK